MAFRKRSEAVDRQVLVENEQVPYRGSAIDNNFGGSANPDRISPHAESSDEDEIKCMPAILPTMDNELNPEQIRSHGQILMTDAPPDRYNYTYAVFYLLGIATMTPWNFFVTADDVSWCTVWFEKKNQNHVKTCSFFTIIVVFCAVLHSKTKALFDNKLQLHSCNRFLRRKNTATFFFSFGAQNLELLRCNHIFPKVEIKNIQTLL
uniref:Equilibrative nucleoside transporter 1 n=1 Tax=Bactrocera latifrons TaxID=174628 RepID=A0A0K8UG48_BACLA